jgi:aminoglycoside phosphotransferase (APT) family kinase protein
MEALMRESLEQGLSAQRERAVRVSELHQCDFRSGSSFSINRLRVVLDDGESLGMFCKDLNPMHQRVEARAIRSLELQRSRRELWMYREVLDAERLGTPRFYGHRWEPKRGLLWLFIEDVGPKRLSRVGDFDIWVNAAAWLAKFHAAMKGMTLNAGLLVRHDNARFRERAEGLAERLPDVSVQQHAVLRRALDLHDEIVDSLDDQPRGLIHGEYFGKNVVIRVGSAERQIATIDWETAGYGLLYRDLTDISAGRWTREQRLTMWRAYYDQYCRDTGCVLGWERFLRDVSHVALAQAIAWLGWWSKGDDEHIARWIRELERIISDLVFS